MAFDIEANENNGCRFVVMHKMKKLAFLLFVVIVLFVSCNLEHVCSFDQITQQCACGAIREGVVAYEGSSYEKATARYVSLQTAIDSAQSGSLIHCCVDHIDCQSLSFNNVSVGLDLAGAQLSVATGASVTGGSVVVGGGKITVGNCPVFTIRNGNLSTSVDFSGGIDVDAVSKLAIESGTVKITEVKAGDDSKNITLKSDKIEIAPSAVAQLSSHISESSTAQPTVAGHTHEYVKDTSYVKVPTCNEEGAEKYVCGCGLVYYSVLEKDPHTMVEGKCTECGHHSLGSIGPAGGYVFYDCDEDNDKGNADGLISTECGWRYLEASPEDLNVGSNTSFIFGYYRNSSSGINLYVDGKISYTAGTSSPNDGKCTGTAIGTGETNTAKLVKEMGIAAYTSSSGIDTTDQYAANLADNYVYNGCDDWFLPSEDELNLMYTNLHKAGLGSFASELYWSSSEGNTNAYNAWKQYFSDGSQYNSTRYSNGRVRCVRSFTPIEQLNPSTIYLAETTEPTCTESGWKVYRYVDTDKEACRVLDKEPTGHTMGLDGYHCSSCGHLMAGITGPAGGYVFYDCDEDNDKGNADGLISTECGWRYLEAAPEDLKVGSTTTFRFGYYRNSSSGSNLYVNGTISYVEGTSNPNDGKSTGIAIGTGKANTAKLVKAMGSAAYSSYSGTGTTVQYAAKLADAYVYGGHSDWFLPSRDELNLMYTNLHKAGLGSFASENYWSSSESHYGAYIAWNQYFSNGIQYYYGNHIDASYDVTVCQY